MGYSAGSKRVIKRMMAARSQSEKPKEVSVVKHKKMTTTKITNRDGSITSIGGDLTAPGYHSANVGGKTYTFINGKPK